MKNIEIEDDIYEHLLANVEYIGESASSILRRLLGLQKETSLIVDSTELVQFLSSVDFRSKTSAVDRFLAILSFAYKDRGQRKFERILSLTGQKRKYFGKNFEEVDESGKSVFPKQIPGTPFWVVSNTDTPKKKRILRGALNLLDFSKNEVSVAVAALDRFN